MSDSATELLFSIGADTAGADTNLQRFRALMGKSLDDLAGEFHDWSTQVFGNLSTVSGAMTAGADALETAEAKTNAGMESASAQVLEKLSAARTQWTREEFQAFEEGQTRAVKYSQEMGGLSVQSLSKLMRAQMTAQGQLTAEYQADRARWSALEEQKTKDLANNGAERLKVEQAFAAGRQALDAKFAMELQALHNSQGWQGVFGSEFAKLLKGNDAALKEWATSANQGMLMVQLSLTALDGIGREAFQHLSEGMGRNIASAIVYSKSIGDAMRAALASTLESIAAESLVQAIYSLAFGFLCLAEGNFAGAESAFTAAAIFGTVGGAAAVAGRATVGSQRTASGMAASGRGGASSSGGWANASSAPGYTSGSAGGPHVTVNVMGHVFGVSGVQQLASALNDAVLNQDVTLTATNTKTGVQVTR